MGKKNKDQVPAVNLNSVTNRDILQRMNFLYQASAYLNSISPSREPQPSQSQDTSTYTPGSVPSSQVGQPAGKRKQPKKLRIRHPTTTHELARSYVDSMRSIGQKTTVKMDPAVKRTLCRKCDVVLIPGVSATVRVKSSSSHGHAMSYTCMTCKTIRRIPAPPTLHLEVTEPVHTEPPHATQEEVVHALDMLMDTTADGTATGSSAPNTRDSLQRTISSHKRKKPRAPHIPPLFERKVGHAVFRGNEQLEEGMAGWAYNT
ncbi:hypothetical protein CERSUDRAFT_123546 [Gelatoporia subvermispora B]|uniref:Rpr2-domain-containing protein n=1 Tax=Ceriporiopsis subvermispora (strain B) TaxID=914234 RepID=M2QZK4_CERS8|nr:hypothetical protein CERSUDRAFT_123546 [Gelatoporia subvermispora B]